MATAKRGIIKLHKGGNNMAYFVEFTHENESERIAETPDRVAAIAIGQAKQKEYKAAGKCGIISAYEITTERGIPMRKCAEFWEV